MEQGLYDDIKRLEKQFNDCASDPNKGFLEPLYKQGSGMTQNNNKRSDQVFEESLKALKERLNDKEASQKIVSKIKEQSEGLQKQKKHVESMLLKCRNY